MNCTARAFWPPGCTRCLCAGVSATHLFPVSYSIPRRTGTRVAQVLASPGGMGRLVANQIRNLNMLNPFLGTSLSSAERERKRREAFKFGVFAALAAMTLLLAGLLIQGCRNNQVTADESTVASGEPATHSSPDAAAPPTVQPPTAQTNAAPTPTPPPANAAAPEPVPDAPLAPAPVAPASQPSLYTIHSGDTLGKIAKAHGTTVSALKALNHLKSDRITAGDKLKLPSLPAKS